MLRLCKFLKVTNVLRKCLKFIIKERLGCGELDIIIEAAII